MPREPLPLSTHSNIHVAGYVEDGFKPSGAKRLRKALDGEEPTAFRATTRYRGNDGRTRTAEAWSRGDDASKAKAEKALRASVKRFLAAGGRKLGQDMRVSELGEAWLLAFRSGDRVRPQTADGYADHLRRDIIPSLGGLKLHELETWRITDALEQVAERSPSAAKQCRVVLKHMCAYAVQRGAMSRNPVTGDVPTFRSKPEQVRALTVAELQSLRSAITNWQNTPHAGPPRGRNLLDLVDFMLLTGCRPGEALAVRWKDVELGAEPTVTINATIVAVAGRSKLIRQESTKTDSGHRIIPLGRAGHSLMLRLASEGPDSDLGLVFPARGGGIMSPNNFRSTLRRALISQGLGHLQPKLLRKTAATVIERKDGLEAASKNLGHSGTAVTAKHYVERDRTVPDSSAALDALYACL